tara:strand:- start:778 stop:1872 length:1095 start_codon:yes stop_codon:yes gene_type:complete
MLDALKTLFENDVVSEEVRASIEEAWNGKIEENKKQATAELREEFARKYEHDKQTMVEAIDSMLSERLTAEISEFTEDRKQLAEAKAKYAVAMRENAGLLQKFVTQQLSKEVSELHEDQKVMASKFAKLEEFVVEALSKEIAEFYEDKKDLAETKVKLVKEAKEKFAAVQKNFVKRGAEMVSETVSKSLNKEISQLKEDIEAARQNDFGRRIFEAYSNEFSTSYINEKSESAKLMKVVALKEKQLAEAKATAAKAIKLAESKEVEKQRLVQSATRKDTINELTAPLNKAQREIMTDLLESVQTAKLRSAFGKYLPTVIDGNTPAKQKAQLTEGKEVTGNRDETVTQLKAKDENVFELRRLAGLN